MMRKFGKMRLLALSLGLCLLAALPARAEAGNETELSGGFVPIGVGETQPGKGSAVTVTPGELVCSEEARTVTVTIAVDPGAEITAYGGNVAVPEGWSVKGSVKVTGTDAEGDPVTSKKTPAAENSYSFNNTYADGMTATALEITYNVPAEANGTFTLGVENLILSKNGRNQLAGNNSGVTATAEFTVAGGAVTPAYAVGPLTVRSPEGAALTAIPEGDFLVTVPVTKTAGEGDCLVLLCAYGAAGQFRGLLYVQLEDVPEGATVKVTLPVENAGGDIAGLKAFCAASFTDLTPLGEAVSF